MLMDFATQDAHAQKTDTHIHVLKENAEQSAHQTLTAMTETHQQQIDAMITATASTMEILTAEMEKQMLEKNAKPIMTAQQVTNATTASATQNHFAETEKQTQEKSATMECGMEKDAMQEKTGHAPTAMNTARYQMFLQATAETETQTMESSAMQGLTTEQYVHQHAKEHATTAMKTAWHSL